MRDRATLAEQLAGPEFSAPAVEAMVAELRPLTPEILDWLAGLEQTPNRLYLHALAAEELNDATVVDAWTAFLKQATQPDPLHLLAYARVLAAHDHPAEAVRQLRRALLRPASYAFFPRAGKVVDQVFDRAPYYREAKVALLGTSTTSLLAPVLKALCLRDGIRAEFYQGLYGAVEQEVLDERGGLAGFRPTIVYLVTHWRDLELPAVTPNPELAVRNRVERQQTLWQRLADRFQCHVVQHAYDYPADESYGDLAHSMPGGRSRMIAAINHAMRQQAPAFVSVLDLPGVQRKAGQEQWESAFQWHSFKQHPATDALPLLAEEQAAHLRAVLGLTRKVLVTDLDNTLWAGIIGEDGLQGIRVGPGTAAGEAHRHLQEYLLELKSRGILLAVCSKNNPEDARLPFEKHEHMALRLDDFAAFEANWNDKVSNLRAIAEKLSLGLDSFVFLDDSPLEREWVRAQLPQVAVVEPGPSVHSFVRAIDRAGYFFSLTLSREDVERAQQYRDETRRNELSASAGSLDEFLAGLQLTAAVEPVSEANLARVTQLINKTNQFNLTTRRYTEQQVREAAHRPDAWAAVFQLSDRMGTYGLIGVMICVPAPSGDWEVDTWLMSCRSLGRQMELFMFDRMIEEARRRGVHQIAGVYRPTKKNVLVADLYGRLGFSQTVVTPEETRYEIMVSEVRKVAATHVRSAAKSA